MVYYPYERGEELPAHPAVTSWWLKLRIADTDGTDHDSYFYVLVVRDQSVVGDLILNTDSDLHGIVTRSP